MNVSDIANIRNNTSIGSIIPVMIDGDRVNAEVVGKYPNFVRVRVTNCYYCLRWADVIINRGKV